MNGPDDRAIMILFCVFDCNSGYGNAVVLYVYCSSLLSCIDLWKVTVGIEKDSIKSIRGIFLEGIRE